jgi:hypothetical protein
MSSETILKKRKKKRGEFLLLTDFECLSDDEIIKSISNIRLRLRNIFRTHVGENNSITPVDLFEKVYGINPDSLDIFKKTYWWNVLKNVLRQMRSEDTLFVINKGTKLFVLQTEEEAETFKDRVDRDIERMKNIKIKADEWVAERKWKKL